MVLRSPAVQQVTNDLVINLKTDLRSDATGFAEVVVAPDRSERSGSSL
jgi:hypothetical protein